MFAFASWDDTTERLMLVRDRIGKKPLSITTTDASCLQLLPRGLAEGRPPAPEIDPAAVEAYLSLGYIPAPLTILKGVRKLRAAECIAYEGGEAKASTFWSLAGEAAQFEGGYDEALDHLDGLLARAPPCD